MKLVPIDRSEVPPLEISPRLRTQLVYFATADDARSPDDFVFDPEEVDRVLDEGVVYLVSPLDTANMTEVEISEEQEVLLQWLQKHRVGHVRVEG